MNGWLDALRRGMNPRTYALLAALVVTLLWIQSLDTKQRAMRERAAAARDHASVATAAPAPGPAADRSKDGGAEEWGRDPFEPRFGEGRR
jgi:hypothetical protein